jgi:hypothetical protein
MARRHITPAQIKDFVSSGHLALDRAMELLDRSTHPNEVAKTLFWNETAERLAESSRYGATAERFRNRYSYPWLKAEGELRELTVTQLIEAPVAHIIPAKRAELLLEQHFENSRLISKQVVADSLLRDLHGIEDPPRTKLGMGLGSVVTGLGELAGSLPRILRPTPMQFCWAALGGALEYGDARDRPVQYFGISRALEMLGVDVCFAFRAHYGIAPERRAICRRKLESVIFTRRDRDPTDVCHVWSADWLDPAQAKNLLGQAKNRRDCYERLFYGATEFLRKKRVSRPSDEVLKTLRRERDRLNGLNPRDPEPPPNELGCPD